MTGTAETLIIFCFVWEEEHGILASAKEMKVDNQSYNGGHAPHEICLMVTIKCSRETWI